MKQKRYLIAACVSAALAVLLIVLVRCTDVAPIGPEGTCVGLSGLNAAAHARIGEDLGWYRLTQALGIAALAVAGLFALLGLIQLLRRKSLRRVDRELLLLGGLYAAVLCLYALFEVAVVNRRPVLLPGEEYPAASFPSSHTMLVCVIFGGAALLSGRYLRSPKLRCGAQTLCAVLIAVMAAGRLISGVHWLTDILGGLLISAALLSLFAWLLPERRDGKNEKTGENDGKRH